MPQPLIELIAAVFTPFSADRRVALDVIEAYARMLVRDGVAGVFVCGSSGEGPSLSVEERMQVAERWLAVAGGELRVVVHVGHNSQSDARRLAEHAGRIGAHATSCVPPSYFKPKDLTCLIDFLAPVAAAAGLPFYYYHIPRLTGVDFSMVELLAEADGAIPGLRGIKYSHGDFIEFKQCRDFDEGRFEMLWGRDEFLLGAVAMAGAKGAIGTTYNLAAPLYLEMLEAYRGGQVDQARRLAGKVFGLVNLMLTNGGIVAAKAMLAMRGIDCGSARPPLPRLAPDQYERLCRQVEALEVLEEAGKIGS